MYYGKQDARSIEKEKKKTKRETQNVRIRSKTNALPNENSWKRIEQVRCQQSIQKTIRNAYYTYMYVYCTPSIFYSIIRDVFLRRNFSNATFRTHFSNAIFRTQLKVSQI